jgi:hypothetical protein
MNLKRLAQLQTKLHEQNSMLPASHSDLNTKIAKQQLLVDQISEQMQTHTVLTSPQPQISLTHTPMTKKQQNHLHPPTLPQSSHQQQWSHDLSRQKPSHSHQQLALSQQLPSQHSQQSSWWPPQSHQQQRQQQRQHKQPENPALSSRVEQGIIVFPT